MNIPTKRILNVTIRSLAIVILPIAIMAMLKSSSEPVIFFLKDTVVENSLKQWETGNSIIFNISIGYIVSFLFWVMNVALPGSRKRKLLKNNLKKQYKYFKHDVIRILMNAYETYRRDYDDSLQIYFDKPELVDKLCHHEEFKRFFSADGNKNWYAVLNGLQYEKSHLSDLYIEFGILADDISYVLNNVNIDDDEVVSFFKNFSSHTYRLKNASVYSDDQAKYLGNFLWEILAQWSFIHGHRKKDQIFEMINQI